MASGTIPGTENGLGLSTGTITKDSARTNFIMDSTTCYKTDGVATVGGRCHWDPAVTGYGELGFLTFMHIPEGFRPPVNTTIAALVYTSPQSTPTAYTWRAAPLTVGTDGSVTCGVSDNYYVNQVMFNACYHV